MPHGYRRGSSGVFVLSIGLTAYTLGLRHAFDADHIAAIDNSTCKLMSEEQRPLTVGFFFALGHDTIVFALGVLVACGTPATRSARTRRRAPAQGAVRSARRNPTRHIDLPEQRLDSRLLPASAPEGGRQLGGEDRIGDRLQVAAVVAAQLDLDPSAGRTIPL